MKRITARLIEIAAILAAGVVSGCGTSEPATCGSRSVPVAQACAIVEGTPYGGGWYGGTAPCPCGLSCSLPPSFVSAFDALNPDAGAAGASTAECPTSPATVTVTCGCDSTGRLTAGYCFPEAHGESERLASMAYLEAVSVRAFNRLERELLAHGAPASLRRDARRARRDEVRHTAMMSRLARRRGLAPRMPEAPAMAHARSLVDIALENAVEGCVRETYGAVQGLVEGQTSPDRVMRRVMAAVAVDECRHAELAWAVHQWAMPRLTAEERARVQAAMQEAIAEIAQRDPRAAGMLFPATREVMS